MDYLIYQYQFDTLMLQISDTARELSELEWKLRNLSITPDSVAEYAYIEGELFGLELAKQILGFW